VPLMSRITVAMPSAPSPANPETAAERHEIVPSRWRSVKARN